MDFLPDFSKLLIVLIGYLFGSLPRGFLAGKWLSGIDLREMGSGSTGATNVLRHVGKGPALAVFLIDVIKGTAIVLLARSIQLEDNWQVAAGLSALAGHIWPCWLGWKGGKAVATGLGIFLGLSWAVGLASLGIFVTVLSISKIVSLSSISASISLPLLMILSFQGESFRPAYFSISLLAMLLVLWRHRSNFSRLIAGKEPRVGQPR